MISATVSTAVRACVSSTLLSNPRWVLDVAALPTVDLKVQQVRSPIKGPFAAAKYDWYTNYGDFACTNANEQELKPPLRMRWVSEVWSEL